MLHELVWLTALLGVGLGCSCLPGSFDKSHSTVICEAFRNVDNIYIGVVQEIYCKCLISTEQPEDFSCVKYDMAGGSRNAETQETFTCKNQDDDSYSYYQRLPYYFQECTKISEKIFGPDESPSINLTKTPVTNLTDQMNCGFTTASLSDDINNGSGCILTPAPCYYTVNVTKVFKGNMTVGSFIVTKGPVTYVFDSCGQGSRVLKIGREYAAGIGGSCSPIIKWPDLCDYDIADILEKVSDDFAEVCDSAATITYSGTVMLLLVALLVISIF